jgi:hypothetical protein
MQWGNLMPFEFSISKRMLGLVVAKSAAAVVNLKSGEETCAGALID